MDIRDPYAHWRRRPSLSAVIAVLSLLLLFVGIFISNAPSVTTDSTGTLLDATGRGRDGADALPDALFAIGTALAAIFLVVYIVGTAREGDPRRGRYKSD
jgi:hypothetical protein